MTAASVSGAVSSSLAWYAYSTRALVSYSGTSVSDVSLLQIGICSDVVVPDMPSSVFEVQYEGDSNHYYFSESGKGLTYDVITKYLSVKGYATNELNPTTSGSFMIGDGQEDFSLKKSPNELVHGNSILSDTSNYLTIPFVFRVQGEGDSFFDERELWLSKAISRASNGSDDDSEVYKAIRVFVDRDYRNYGVWKIMSDDIASNSGIPSGDLGKDYYLNSDDHNLFVYDAGNDEWNLLASGIRVETTAQDLDEYSEGAYYYNSTNGKLYRRSSKDFIFNPSATSRGSTRVGGLLNISRDDYFDFDGNGEIIYGEYDPAALNLISSTPYEGADVVHDVNGVGSNEPSTFVAKHYPYNTKYYTDFSASAYDALFGHADYESLASIAPIRDSRDYLANVDPNNPTSVCKTRADDHHLARVNLTVWLEGWDFSVINKEISHGFDLGLTFEMSRI